MKTMNLQEAAAFLHIHVVTLSRMAKRGEVPCAKIGKRWVFVEVDLIEWLRAKYAVQASLSDFRERSNTCHSSCVKIRQIGGSNLVPRTESEYNKALGLLIE